MMSRTRLVVEERQVWGRPARHSSSSQWCLISLSLLILLLLHITEQSSAALFGGKRASSPSAALAEGTVGNGVIPKEGGLLNKWNDPAKRQQRREGRQQRMNARQEQARQAQKLASQKKEESAISALEAAIGKVQGAREQVKAATENVQKAKKAAGDRERYLLALLEKVKQEKEGATTQTEQAAEGGDGPLSSKTADEGERTDSSPPPVKPQAKRPVAALKAELKVETKQTLGKYGAAVKELKAVVKTHQEAAKEAKRALGTHQKVAVQQQERVAQAQGQRQSAMDALMKRMDEIPQEARERVLDGNLLEIFGKMDGQTAPLGADSGSPKRLDAAEGEGDHLFLANIKEHQQGLEKLMEELDQGQIQGLSSESAKILDDFLKASHDELGAKAKLIEGENQRTEAEAVLQKALQDVLDLKQLVKDEGDAFTKLTRNWRGIVRAIIFIATGLAALGTLVGGTVVATNGQQPQEDQKASRRLRSEMSLLGHRDF